ncbi:MAG: hypothetical protein WBC71_07010, partial [Salaquimonas sp.]
MSDSANAKLVDVGVLFGISLYFLLTILPGAGSVFGKIENSYVSNFSTPSHGTELFNHEHLRGTLGVDGFVEENVATFEQGGWLEQLHTHTILLILHVAGLVAGLGGTLFLDLYLLRYLYHRPLTLHVFELLEFGGKIVSMGLVTLWISGIGFLFYYWAQVPENLSNPKIWAKLSVVCILSLNGLAIHRLV